jgi:hypothetical protein
MWRQDDLRRTKEAPELRKRTQHENVRIQIDDRFLPLEEEGQERRLDCSAELDDVVLGRRALRNAADGQALA